MTAKNSDSLWMLVRIGVLIALALLAHKMFAADPPSPPPLVYLITLEPEAAEAGAEPATFLVLRIGETNQSLTVLYQSAGTAENGVDYAPLPGAVTIPAGSYFAELAVTPIDDTLVEGAETVLIGLDQPLVWPPPYIVGWPSIALGWIVDDDRAPTNRPPHVALVNPPDGSVFMAPADIRLVARASDSDGRVRTVEFFEGTNSLGIVTNHPRPVLRGSLGLEAELAQALDPEEFPDFNLDPTPIDPNVIPGHLFRLLWEDVRPGHYALSAVATDDDGAQTRSAPVEIRVTELPPQPVVNVIAVDPIAAEGPWPGDPADVLNTATFVVRRSGNTNIPLTVYYRLSGTASNGVDYESLPHSVTIAAGERGAHVVVAPIDDALVEGPETVVLTIAPPICQAIFPPPPDCYIVGRHDRARAVIRDNDPQPTNRPPVVEIVRPLDGSVFLSPADVAIVAQARDYDGRVVSVEFFEGTNSLGVVSNSPAASLSNRPPFLLVWSNVPPGHYVLRAEATDNDGAVSESRPVEIKVVERTIPPTVNIVATQPSAWEQGGLNSPLSLTSAVNTAVFTVTRTGPTTGALRVHYSLGGSASNGVDYRRLTGVVVIPSGANAADIVIHPIDDLLVEGTEDVIAGLDSSPCLLADAALRDCYVVGTNSRALAIIRDNDVSPGNQPPKVALVQPEDGDRFLAPADIRLVAEARDADGFVRQVEFFANGSSLGVVSNRNLVIGGNVDAAHVDSLFQLAWSNVLAGDYVLTATATDNRGTTTTSDAVRIKVVFPEPPLVTIEATDPYAMEGLLVIGPANLGDDPVPIPFNDTATFTVKRSRGTNEPLVVHYRLSGTASNGVDYRPLSGEVTIPRGAWRANIVVDPIDDLLIEGTETVVATLAPIACPLVFPAPVECYAVGEPHRAVAYIRDNDFNRPPRVEIVSPTDGTIFRALADIEIDVLARDSDGYVTKVEFFAGTNRIGVDERIFIQPPPPGQLQRFSITWSNVPPGEYKLWVRATDDDGAMTVSEGVKVIVVPPMDLPVVTIETFDKAASEQGPAVPVEPDTAVFLVKRSGGTNRPLAVAYDIGGTARNGVDYRELSGEVIIPAGAESARIVVEAIDDALVEGIETVVLALEKPDCPAVSPALAASRSCYLVGEPGRTIAFIRDNDSPPPGEAPHIAILVPGEDQTFMAPADIEILAVGFDPDGWITQVQFFEGTNEIGGLAILVGEPPPPGELQVFQFNWTDVPPGNYSLTAKATDNRGRTTVSGEIHIRVLDACRVPVVTITAVDPVATEPRPDALAPIDTATFAVRRSCDFDRPLLVRYRVSGTASNGVDYIGLPGEVLIPAGDSFARIVVRPLDDNLVERTETVIVELTQPLCLATDPPPADCYLVGPSGRAVAFIRDNDSHPPRIAITSPANGDVFHAPANIHLVARTLDPDGWVTQVEFFANGISIGVRPMLFIVEPPPGELQTFELRWTNVVAGGYELSAVATDNAGLTTRSAPVNVRVIEPPAVPTVTIVARDSYAREGEPTNTATFRIRRDCCTNASLTVWYAISGSASNGVDYAEIGNFVTIPAGRYAAPVVITPVDDFRPEPVETIVLQLQPSPVLSPLPTYQIGQPEAAAAIIVDNDRPMPASQRLVDGLVHLCLPAVNGSCYRIEASTDLVNWEVVCRNTVVGNTINFIEPRGRDAARRFYRVVPDICESEE